MTVSLRKTTDAPAPSARVNLALLHVYVRPELAARLGVITSVPTPDHSPLRDYSDGYGGTYAPGE